LTGAPVIIDWANYEGTNSAILIDPQARLVDSYAKLHPVPFAEAIPFWDVKFFREFIQNVVGLASGWIMGSEYTIMKLPLRGAAVSFGAPICFEDAFPDVCRQFYLRGADVLINLTNISWSRTISAEIQHWAAARFRAIESRHTLVRSTNGGVSCVVDPYGRNLVSLPLFESTARYVQVPVYDPGRMTPYIAYGDWFALAAVLLFAVSAVILMIKEFRPAFFNERAASIGQRR
jgi:apolipoprotein N-acyltransferase